MIHGFGFAKSKLGQQQARGHGRHDDDELRNPATYARASSNPNLSQIARLSLPGVTLDAYAFNRQLSRCALRCRKATVAVSRPTARPALAISNADSVGGAAKISRAGTASVGGTATMSRAGTPSDALGARCSPRCDTRCADQNTKPSARRARPSS